MKHLRFCSPSSKSVSQDSTSFSIIKQKLTIIVEVDPSDCGLIFALHQNNRCAPIFALDCRQAVDHSFDVLCESGFVAWVDNKFQQFSYFVFSVSHDTALLEVSCCVPADSEGEFVCSWLLLLFGLFLSFFCWNKRIFRLPRHFDVHNH